MYVCVSQVNYLLPTSSFVSHLTSSLLCHESVRVREKAHLLLNTRLKQLNADHLTDIQVTVHSVAHQPC